MSRCSYRHVHDIRCSGRMVMDGKDHVVPVSVVVVILKDNEVNIKL